MKIRLKHFGSLALAFGSAVAVTQAQLSFREIGGQVVIEAEDFVERINRDDGHHWQIMPDGDPEFSDVGIGNWSNWRNADSGGKYIQAVPETGLGLTNPAGNEGFAEPPIVIYPVTISTPGRYRLYVRWKGESGGSDSLYVHIVELINFPHPETGEPVGWYRLAAGSNPDDANFATVVANGWDGVGGPNLTSASGGEIPMLWDLTPGQYTIRFWPREDSVAMDALILQLADLPPPTGDGPPATPPLPPEPAPAKIIRRTPAPAGRNVAFDTAIEVIVLEGTTKVADSSVQFTVNGQVVSPTVGSRVNVGPGVDSVTLSVAPPVFPNLYPSGADVTVNLKFTDTAGTATDETWTFTVQSYVNVPPEWAAADVDTSKRGFLVRTHQLADRRHVLGDRGNRIPPAEKQLAGRVGENVADPTPFTQNGFFVETSYINYNQDAATRDDAFSSVGNFGAATDPVKPENPIPGVPSATFFDPVTGAPWTDHAAVEAMAYLELPAGIISMGVNSDDGFRLTLSPVGALADKFGLMIAEFDGGRGAANTQTRFVVQQAGRYAMRLMWYEGTGGFNCEWFTVQPDGTRVLINDPNEPAAIKAYYARTGPEPTHVSVLDPFPFGSTLALTFPDDPIHIEIIDGATAVQRDSVQLKVNGQSTSPTITQAGGKTTIELAPPGGLWAPGAVNVELTYTHNPTVTQAWSFSVMNYVTLEECLRTAVGTGQQPGMLWRTHQWDRTGTRANTVAAAEAQLANEVNSADLSFAVNGVFEIDYVNFEQSGVPDGLIHDNQPDPRNAFELIVPGLPGLGSVGNPQDNVVGEARAFIEFPQPGLYLMGVNSDDGFQLTVASSEGGRDVVTGPNVQVIASLNVGRGIDDNNVQDLMPIFVPQAGVWPFRLLWYEGNGGAAVEWYQTDKRNAIGLINDPLHSNTLRAFRSRSAQPAAPEVAPCAAVTEPTIAVSRTATGITLRFEGTLQQADEVTGPYTDVTGATSPHNVTADQARRFFRARR